MTSKEKQIEVKAIDKGNGEVLEITTLEKAIQSLENGWYKAGTTLTLFSSQGKVQSAFISYEITQPIKNGTFVY